MSESVNIQNTDVQRIFSWKVSSPDKEKSLTNTQKKTARIAGALVVEDYEPDKSLPKEPLYIGSARFVRRSSTPLSSQLESIKQTAVRSVTSQHLSPAKSSPLGETDKKISTIAPRIIQGQTVINEAQGKAKQVYITSEYAYIVPLKESKQKEIETETQTAKTIKENLEKSGGKEWSQYLATDYEQMTGTDSIDGKYTLRTSKAEADLEHGVTNRQLTLEERLALGSQAVASLVGMHASGHVHGDLKLDNFLLYPGGGLKLADFGKTQPVEEQEVKIHSGNMRFAAPEGVISKKAEVYSAGLILVRILEEDVLNEDKKMLLEDSPNLDLKASVSDKRRGIERFVILNKECPQVDGSLFSQLKSRVTMLAKYLFYSTQPSPSFQPKTEVDKYVDALFEELNTKHPADAGKLLAMKEVIQQMLRENPADRPDMKDVYDRVPRAQVL